MDFRRTARMKETRKLNETHGRFGAGPGDGLGVGLGSGLCV